jgi:hypothetical protein
MDGSRFDAFTKVLAAGISRRKVAKGLAGGMIAGVAALLGRPGADAQQVTQAYCGNKVCADDPSVCNEGCVCCEFGNGNSRCMPPNNCQRLSGSVTCPAGESLCDGECVPGGCCPLQPDGGACTTNEACCSGICQGGSCVATIAGTCGPGQDYCTEGPDVSACGGGACLCFPSAQGGVVCTGGAFCDESCSACEDAGGVCGKTGELLCHCVASQVLCLFPCLPVPGCFTGATRITLADGAAKPIDQITVGDRVLGQGGFNTVLAITTPRLGDRRLYALNGSAFFVTASHPFLTEDGWKSIDPAATALEHSELPVGRLVLGDRLLALATVAAPAFAVAGGTGRGEDVVAPRLQSTPLRSLVGVLGDPATQLYNLRVDGDHTYFADDLLVHNKA